MLSRREVLAALLAALPATLLGQSRRRGAARVIVVGAGAFGGWTALELARRGAEVVLVDMWGAGNVRASSGGETRVIRGAYGGERLYTDMARRSLERWRGFAAEWERPLLARTGMLWMFEQDDDAYARRSVDAMRANGLPLEELTLREAATRYPQISFDGIRRVWWEPEAGYLMAREGCELVRRSVQRAGGTWLQARAQPAAIDGDMLRDVVLTGERRLGADRFVFACGPWLSALFGAAVARPVRPTKQDVLYFGTPPGDARFDPPACPVWLNAGERWLYGIPGNERRGFKVADDTLGAPVDPSSFERVLDTDGIRLARALLARRFPALAGAPLVHGEVCQYERTPDGHFVIDWHPEARNVLLVGGGSGHGYKMGPAVGELAAAMILDQQATPPLFRNRPAP